MKLTFVHAPTIQYDQNYGTLFSPLWAYTLAAHLPPTSDVEIVDCTIEEPDHIGPSDIFAFSGINQDLDSIRRVFDILKPRYPEATFILGGPITWSMEQEGKIGLLDHFDHIFILDGERSLPAFLDDVANRRTVPKIVRAERFPMDQCRPIRFDLYTRVARHYYGAVVEVSRGCPFLCEFCDIRVLPGNNRANNKSVELIVEELDAYHKLGVTQFQFACDNFIGDIAWARRCVDAVIHWKERTGARISIFTWLTINLYKLPDLMEKMRRAGFSILFIGIESVNRNSLLETAKVQNSKGLEPAVRAIQAYGFIIAPGFIFGFDSDSETVFDDTLAFLRDSGVIGGDPSFLTALPGTPLFQRMRCTDRLTERPTATVRRKISTNILYLHDSEFLIRGFLDFVARYTSAEFQLARFQNHVRHILESQKYIALDGVGYGSPIEYFRLQWRDPENRVMMFRRAIFLLGDPRKLAAVFKAWKIARALKLHGINLDINFNYWVYVWTNIGLKYRGIGPKDFDIRSVDSNFDIARLLPVELKGDRVGGKSSGDEKVAQQSRYTEQALKALIAKRAPTDRRRLQSP
jgi:radical SAM superfamily enzyme YgiQ (UPF0313 family)